MTSPAQKQLRWVLIAAAATALTLGGTFFGLQLAQRFGHLAVVAVCIFALALIATFFIPIDMLPAIALVAYVVIPRTALALQDVTTVLTPSFFLMLVWAIRSWTSPTPGVAMLRVPLAARVFAIALVSWLGVVLILNRVVPTSIAWIADFAVLFLLPLFVPFSRETLRRLQSTFLILSSILAVYCVLEFSLRFNPIQPLLGMFGIPDVQHWSVYRAYATLGHPLYAGLFFAVSFAIALGRKLEARGRYNLLIAGLCLVGLLTTVSRNSIGAVAVASGLMIIISLVTRSRLSGVTRLALGVLSAAGALAVTQAPVFQDRFDSSEAAGSTAARDAIVQIAYDAASASNWLGGGPGNSMMVAKPFNLRGTIIENAYLQLVISIGIPGVILFVLLLAGGAFVAARRGSLASVGAVAAYAFSIGFFNIIEASEASLVLGGLILLMAWGTPRVESPIDDFQGTHGVAVRDRREARKA